MGADRVKGLAPVITLPTKWSADKDTIESVHRQENVLGDERITWIQIQMNFARI